MLLHTPIILTCKPYCSNHVIKSPGGHSFRHNTSSFLVYSLQSIFFSFLVAVSLVAVSLVAVSLVAVSLVAVSLVAVSLVSLLSK